MKKEIVALVDATGVDGQQKKKNRWLGVLRLTAWKDTDLHTEEKRVNWVTTYDGLVEMANSISKNMIVKLIVEDKDSYFNLIEVVQAPATDDELARIQQQAKKPVYYDDRVLGKFKYDKQFNWFTKKVSWANEKGYVYIHNAEQAILNEQFEYVATLLDESHLQDMKQFAAVALAPLTEEWGGKALAASDLLNKLKFKELVLRTSGDFTVYLGAGKVFGDHLVQIEGNRMQGVKAAFI